MPLIGSSPKSFYAGLRTVPVKDAPLPQFPNPDFDDGFDNWDLIMQWQAPGGAGTTNSSVPNRVILGCPIPPDPTPFPIGKYAGNPTQSPGQTTRFPNYINTPIPDVTFKASIVPGGPTGNYAELEIRGGVDPGGATVYGPALVSQNPVIAAEGDRISFNWIAKGGGDAYNVLAYIIDKTTCRYFIMLDATGESDTAVTNWATVNKVIGPGEAGNYFFVFLCGTFDYTFGRAVGAQLGVDSIKIEKAGTY